METKLAQLAIHVLAI